MTNKIKNKKAQHSVVAVTSIFLFLLGLIVVLSFGSTVATVTTGTASVGACERAVAVRAKITSWESEHKPENPSYWDYINPIGPDNGPIDASIRKIKYETIDRSASKSREKIESACLTTDWECKGTLDEIGVCIYTRVVNTFYVLFANTDEDFSYSYFNLYRISFDSDSRDAEIWMRGKCEEYTFVTLSGTETYSFNSERVGGVNPNIQMSGTSLSGTNSDNRLAFLDDPKSSCSSIDDWEPSISLSDLNDNWICYRKDGGDYIKIHPMDWDVSVFKFSWDWDSSKRRKFDCRQKDVLTDNNICYQDISTDVGNVCEIKFNHLNEYTIGLSMIAHCHSRGVSSSSCKCFAMETKGYSRANGLPLGAVSLDSDAAHVFNDFSKFPANYEEGVEWEWEQDYRGCGWSSPETYGGKVLIGSGPTTTMIDRERIVGFDSLNLGPGDFDGLLYARLTSDGEKVEITADSDGYSK